MNFDFPEELKQLRDEARSFLADKCPTTVPRRILDQGGGYDAALWAEMGALGWIGASVPEAYGGAGLGTLAVCVLAEELGRAIAPVPYSSSVYLAIEAIAVYGSEAQKKTWLPRLASGELIGTFAGPEQAGALLPEKMRTRLGDGRLTGTKPAVPDGVSAGVAIVMATDARRGPVLAIADLTGEGVTREAVNSIDPSREVARVAFDGARADVIEAATGSFAIRRWLDRAAIMMAFEQVGSAQASLDMARDYAMQRYAFGRPIGSFQAIKHKLADMYVAVELARSNAYYGAWALSTDAAELPLAASVARIAASDAGWLAGKENVQTHGGMGFTWEGDAHMYYRRSKLLGLALGGTSEWKRRLVGELKSRNTQSAAPQD